MKVKISEIPDDKTFDDYPEGTIFIVEDKFPSLLDKRIPPSKKTD
ncbi:MAG: hypothetical protein RSH79_09295 [Clostridiales bacterium]